MMAFPIRTLLLCVAYAACAFAHARGIPPAVAAADPSISVRDSLLPAAQVVYRAHRSPMPRQSISGPALRHLAGRSVAEALGTLAGLQVRDYGGVGGLKTIDVRGMGTAHTAVFVDGMPLSNEQNGQVDLGRYSAGAFGRIDLCHGGASDLLQGARQWASGNSVALYSRRPEFPDTLSRNRAEIGLRAGSFGRAEPTLRWERRCRRGVAAVADAAFLHAHGRYTYRLRKNFADGSPAYDTTAVRQGGDISAVRAELGLFSAAESRSEWSARAYFYASDRGIPAAVVNNVWGSAQRQSDTDARVQGQWRRHWRGGHATRLSAMAVVERLRYQNPDTVQQRVDRTFVQPALYLSATHLLAQLQGSRGARYGCSVAIDYAYNTLFQASRWALPQGSLQHPQRHTLMSAVAGSLQWRDWRVVAALHHTFTADVSDLSPRRRECFVTPVLSATFRPASCLTFRVLGRRHQRRPSFNELYYREMGNVALRPEQCWQFNAGGDVGHAFCHGALSLTLSADAYVHCVSDKIVAVPRGSGQWRWMMLNVGKVRARGVDLKGSAEWKAPCAVSVGISAHYSLARAEDRSDPTDNDPQFGTFGGQVPYLPRHAGGVSAQVSWGVLSLGYVWSGVGARYRASANTPANRLLPWNTHDVSLLVAVPRVPRLSLSAVCHNLAGRQYEMVPNYPMPRRNFLLGLRYTFLK